MTAMNRRLKDPSGAIKTQLKTSVWCLVLFLALMFPMSSSAAPCGGGDGYESGLCLYHLGLYPEAERVFSGYLESAEPSPEAIKAHYFLARAQMKQKKWHEASREWIRVFGLDPTFYREWSCVFLLGECRRELGQG